MKAIIVYGSTTGITQSVAESISNKLNGDLIEIGDLNRDKLSEYELIILGTSTWGMGDLQDDWDMNLNKLEDIDLSGKYVALFGLGDQEGYTDTFVDGLKEIYDTIKASGCTFIGETSTVGYNFEASKAADGDKFLGLVLDEDCQSNLTDNRVSDWIEQLQSEVK